MSLQGLAPVWVSWDLSRPFGSLEETYKKLSRWLASIGQAGEVFAIPRGRLGNSFLDLV